MVKRGGERSDFLLLKGEKKMPDQMSKIGVQRGGGAEPQPSSERNSRQGESRYSLREKTKGTSCEFIIRERSLLSNSSTWWYKRGPEKKTTCYRGTFSCVEKIRDRNWRNRLIWHN